VVILCLLPTVAYASNRDYLHGRRGINLHAPSEKGAVGINLLTQA